MSMTKKGQQFVSKEIRRFMRKGPSSGPSKGQKMHQKQAVAVALKVARGKGYKVPSKPKREAMLLRSADYGALGLVEVEGGVIVYDHNLDEQDKSGILAVLTSAGRSSTTDDGGTFWKFSAQAQSAIVRSNLQRAIRAAGYEDDPLATKAIIQVSEDEAREPDLPEESRFHLVHEAVEAGIRRHIEIAVAALSEHGLVTPPTVRFFVRPHAHDAIGRPLPFAVARAFIRSDDRASVLAALREALKPVAEYVARATVETCGPDEPMTLEIALAPPAAVCEAYMEASVPVFEAANIVGARTTWIKLGAPLADDGAADIAKLCAVSTGAIGFRTEREGRAVVAQIPSCSEGHYAADRAFHARLEWLVGLLDPWEPEVYEIGEQENISSGAPGESAGLQESDAERRAAERAAALGDPLAVAKYQARLYRGGDLDPDPLPSYIDREAYTELELYLRNTGRLYPQKLAITKNLLGKMRKRAYRRDLAAKGWMYWVDAGAKEYVREFGGGGSVAITFPKKLREFLAMQLAKEFERGVRSGEIHETFSPTPGMTNAAFGVHGAVRRCKKCALGIPKYVGRYPVTCPRCKTRGSIVAMAGESVVEGTGGSFDAFSGVSIKDPPAARGGKQSTPAKNTVLRTGEPQDYDEMLKNLKDKLEAKRKVFQDAEKNEAVTLARGWKRTDFDTEVRYTDPSGKTRISIARGPGGWTVYDSDTGQALFSKPSKADAIDVVLRNVLPKKGALA